MRTKRVSKILMRSNLGLRVFSRNNLAVKAEGEEAVFAAAGWTLGMKEPATQIVGRALFQSVSMIEECAKYPANMQKFFWPCFQALKGATAAGGS
jgi:hypothetical protein